MNTPKKVLVIAPHPDDETLGCGGTLLRHKEKGDSVHCLIITKATSQNKFSKEIEKIQEEQVEKAKILYDFDSLTWLDLPPARLEIIPLDDIIKPISQCMIMVKPEIVYLPWPHDTHTDHHFVFSAAISCCKIFRYPCIKKVLCMEILSETDFSPAIVHNAFQPTVFVDISKYIQQKCEIISCYSSEILPPPFPRNQENVEALAKLRGAASGCLYAEAFVLLKEIIS